MGTLTPLMAGLLLLAGCSSAEEATPAGETMRVGVVEVSVEDLEGMNGGQVAGVLYRGPDLEMPDVRVVGGFGASIDADRFATTESVRVGGDPTADSSGLFPYVTEQAQIVEPGTYTLMLWAADSPIGPYSRWVPGGPESLIGCSVTFELEEGQGASVSIVGGLGDVSFGVPDCIVAE